MTIVRRVRSPVGSTPTSMSTSLPRLDANGGVLGVESFRDDDGRVRRAARLADRLRSAVSGRC